MAAPALTAALPLLVAALSKAGLFAARAGSTAARAGSLAGRAGLAAGRVGGRVGAMAGRTLGRAGAAAGRAGALSKRVFLRSLVPHTPYFLMGNLMEDTATGAGLGRAALRKLKASRLRRRRRRRQPSRQDAPDPTSPRAIRQQNTKDVERARQQAQGEDTGRKDTGKKDSPPDQQGSGKGEGEKGRGSKWKRYGRAAAPWAAHMAIEGAAYPLTMAIMNSFGGEEGPSPAMTPPLPRALQGDPSGALGMDPMQFLMMQQQGRF